MKVTTIGRQAACAALVELLDGGYVQIRSGTPPASALDAATGDVLAVLTLDTPAFTVTGGVATAAAIPVTQGIANGVATWFRAYGSGDAPVEDGTVSALSGSGEMKLNTASVFLGADVTVTSWTITLPEA